MRMKYRAIYSASTYKFSALKTSKIMSNEGFCNLCDKSQRVKQRLPEKWTKDCQEANGL
jgi:hypothetical protein